MSSTYSVKACKCNSPCDPDQKIANMVRLALRKDYPLVKLAAQAIAREIDVDFSAVNRWYNGINAPISWHFLVLMKISPSLFMAVLKEIGYEPASSDFLLNGKDPKEQPCYRNGNSQNPKSGPRNGPINRESRDSILRQRWFIDQIRKGEAPSISSLVSHWNVSRRKAKSDVASLKEKRIIAFVGAKKNGGYVLL